MNKDIVYSDRQTLGSENNVNRRNGTKNCFVWIIISLIGILVIGGGIALIIILTRQQPEIQEPKTDEIDTKPVINSQIEFKPGQKLTKEFEIATKVGDLKGICISKFNR
jgi:hypothetical protein